MWRFIKTSQIILLPMDVGEEEMSVQAGGRGVMGPCDTNQEPISTVSARSLRRLRRGRTHWLKLPRQGTPPTSQQLNIGE